jgi:hypothetical protein
MPIRVIFNVDVEKTEEELEPGRVLERDACAYMGHLRDKHNVTHVAAWQWIIRAEIRNQFTILSSITCLKNKQLHK